MYVSANAYGWSDDDDGCDAHASGCDYDHGYGRGDHYDVCPHSALRVNDHGGLHASHSSSPKHCGALRNVLLVYCTKL